MIPSQENGYSSVLAGTGAKMESVVPVFCQQTRRILQASQQEAGTNPQNAGLKDKSDQSLDGWHMAGVGQALVCRALSTPHPLTYTINHHVEGTACCTCTLGAVYMYITLSQTHTHKPKILPGKLMHFPFFEYAKRDHTCQTVVTKDQEDNKKQTLSNMIARMRGM